MNRKRDKNIDFLQKLALDDYKQNFSYQTGDMDLWHELVKTLSPIKETCKSAQMQPPLQKRAGAFQQKNLEHFNKNKDIFVGVTASDQALLEQSFKEMGVKRFAVLSSKKHKFVQDALSSLSQEGQKVLKKPDLANKNQGLALNLPLPKLKSVKAIEAVLDDKTYKKLSQGQLQIRAVIDLHNLTESEAYTALNVFLEKSYYKKQRYVLVITGKGKDNQAVLKTIVPRWLLSSSFQTFVSHFEQANAKHGGEGALYVRIRKQPVR